MKKINVSKFKEQSLAILDNLNPEGITITKHGRPVARLLPIYEQSANLIGALIGSLAFDYGNLPSKHDLRFYQRSCQ